MSVYVRPNGDDTASLYGFYMSPEEVRELSPGDLVDVLCNDGMNYRGELRAAKDGQGHLHFPGWANRYDFRGSLLKLYLARRGTYTQELPLDNYYTLDAVEAQRIRKSAASVVVARSQVEESGRKSYRELPREQKAAVVSEPAPAVPLPVQAPVVVKSRGEKRATPVSEQRPPKKRAPQTVGRKTNGAVSQVEQEHFCIVDPDAAPVSSSAAEAKLAGLDIQLSKLKEARRQIDDAIQRLERARARNAGGH